MSVNLAKPKLFPLQQLTLHKIAKQLWNILVSQYSEEISVSSEELYNSAYLKDYRYKVLNALPGILSIELPDLLKDKLMDAMIIIRLGCSKAFDWILWHRGIIELSEEINFYDDLERNCQSLLCSATDLDMSEYEAIRFINPLGHFDDLSWAKLFVADENQPLICRFYLACLYCFVEEIDDLWYTMEDNNQFLGLEDFAEIKYESRVLVGIWISAIENERIRTEDTFYVDGFNKAFRGYHEHAVKFFWKRCSEDEREEILSELDFFNLAAAAKTDRIGFVQFIYSLLSEELKSRLISFTIREPEGAKIWGCMFRSFYYKSILNDIWTFPSSIPISFYKRILDALASILGKVSIPVHKEIFELLWDHLSRDERNIVLNSTKILYNLREMADVKFFQMLILPLPCTAKDVVLFQDFQMVGPTMLYRFLKKHDYDTFLRYLLFFFLDYGFASPKLTLRSDAVTLLERFIHCEMYVKRITTKCSSLEKQILDLVIAHFKHTLPMRANGAEITHDFLRKNFPPRLCTKDMLLMFKSGRIMDAL